MKNKRLLKKIIISLGILPLTGCVTTSDNDYQAQLRMRQLQQNDKKQTQKINEYDRLIESQEALIRSLSTAMALNDSRISSLEQQIVSIKRSMGTSTKALEKRLEQERQLREKASKALLGEIANTATTLQERQKRALDAFNKANATSSSTEYKVQSGDTLSVIAQAYGTTVTAIKKANRLNSSVIRVGQMLKIPAK